MKMNKMLRKRLADHRGFSIAELMVTILILVMVSGVVAAGIPVAANAYYKVVDVANGQVLLSTTATAMRTQLESATEIVELIDETNRKGVLFKCKSTGVTGLVWDKARAGDGVLIIPYMAEDDSGKYKEQMDVSNSTPLFTRPLVSLRAATDNLHTEFSSITYDADKKLLTIQNLQVVRIANGETKVIAKMDVFYIRAVNA